MMAENELEKWLQAHPDFSLKTEGEQREEKKSGKKKEEIPEIDLHGLILPKAFARLTQFVRNQPQKIQKIRIIHGKGIHSGEGQRGVLREEVRKWLLLQKNKKDLIKDFAYEKPEAGGWGATIVWLIR